MQTASPYTIDFKPSPKQFEAYEYLTDNSTTELFFGGSVRSGKTRIAMYWVILMSLKYAGTRYLIGRAQLKTLKKSTLSTFLDIIREWNLEKEIKHNQKDDIITFKNGSTVFLQDLKLNPSDPEFQNLRGIELSGVVIDEASEITETVYNVLKTRIDYKLAEHGLTPKFLIVSNPSKGWLFEKFYLPNKQGTLPAHRKVILALPSDNPYNSQSYLDTLTEDNLGLALYQTLVLGNWEFDQSDFALFNHFTIQAAFNREPQIGFGQRYISIDPAGSGADTTVITLWKGWHCDKIIQIENSDTTETVKKVRELQAIHSVHITNIIVDKVGIGQGVFDLLKGCKGFIANATALKNEPYKSLKDQCYYRLAKKFSDGQISIDDTVNRQAIQQELEAHQIFNQELDGKAQVTPKKLVKQMISRSPDFSDSIMMRCYFDFSNIGKITILR